MLYAALCKATIKTFPNGRVTRRLLAEIGKRMPRSSRVIQTRLFTGQPFTVDLSEYLCQDIYVYGSYERPSCEFVLSHLKPGDTFLDVGGHIGLYTVLAGGKVGPTGQVHVFEPGTKQRALLEENVRSNGLAWAIVNPVCVGAHHARAKFIEGPSRNLGTSRVVEDTTAAGPEVEMVSLDDYVASKGIRSIAGMKVDVEGAEVGSSRVDLQACKLEYSIVSPK